MKQTDMTTAGRNKFYRSRLPDAAEYYDGELCRLSRPNAKGWAMARCCFHSPDIHPSLSVNLETGGFHCFSCGEHGGRVLDFYMKRYGVNFKTAAKALGAWK